MVLYTSGTTGPSKGVLVPWGQVGSVAAGVFPEGTYKAGDVLYCPFPPNHIGGRLFPAVGIRHGLPVVIRESFSASEYWADIHRYGITTTALVAAMANILWRAPATDADADNPLVNILMLPVIDEYKSFESRFGVRICTVFNMTEISIAIQSGWDIDDPQSCGRVRTGPPGYELRLVDDHDYPVEPGQVGELVCRTDLPWSLNAGYFGRPQQTAEAWRNGWFHTGDAFRRDEQGRYYFVDRMKDAIRRRGENVSSFEVEREVRDHPDVVDCAAIGVPSALSEEDIKVFVITVPGSRLTASALIEHVKAKCASFMVPTYVEFVDALPMTEATGRVKKAELRVREAESRSRSADL
jgi:carnitine-CoA ligase